MGQLKLKNKKLCKDVEEKDEKIKLFEENIKKLIEVNRVFFERIFQLNLKKNLAKEVKEKGQKIRSITVQLQEANQKNQSLMEDIDQLKLEKRNLIKDFKEKIHVINDQLKEVNTSSNKKINLIQNKVAELSDLVNYLDKLQNETDKPVHFVKLDNKLTSISTVKTCCKNTCINSNVSEGTCINNKGFVRIVDYLKVEYHSVEGKENNKKIIVFAQRPFNKPTNNSDQHLFYFEIQILEKAENQNCYVGIGLAYNGSYTRVVGSNVGDIYGCALVFPTINELKKLPFYFCTQNGNRINGNTYLLKEDGDSFRPFIKLRSCSVEINFGNDLENKPFCYDITKNI
uniref:Uncharacterized protein n=1 Tax=Meloidogyne enterolobii TaxID=390850 RepID=A0A6V7XFJ0_MELEN|nr:unnamed protein product [Meloidogyne enterolobii]